MDYFSSNSSFNLSTAICAAQNNELESWVHAYLCGPAMNTAFSKGLKLQERFWHGPVKVPLHSLTRICGFEETMEYQVSYELWFKNTNQIIQSFQKIEYFPPLIVSYVDGKFIVNDGNHRLFAFQHLGLKSCWVILWYDSLVQYNSHRTRKFTVSV